MSNVHTKHLDNPTFQEFIAALDLIIYEWTATDIHECWPNVEKHLLIYFSGSGYRETKDTDVYKAMLKVGNKREGHSFQCDLVSEANKYLKDIIASYELV